MFRSLTVRGLRGAVTIGGTTAASLAAWTIIRPEGPQAVWLLTARLGRADRWQLKYARPLRFTAPRPGGFWSWPILQVQAVTETALQARLGPPEQ